jgi:hypothetical protein
MIPVAHRQRRRSSSTGEAERNHGHHKESLASVAKGKAEARKGGGASKRGQRGADGHSLLQAFNLDILRC